MDKNRIKELLRELEEKAAALAARLPEKKTKKPVNLAGWLCFAAGLLLAFFVCLAAENFLISKTTENKTAFAEKIKYRAPYFTSVRKSGDGKALVTANPFATDEPSEEKAVHTVSVSDMKLKGTIPDIAAWISTEGTTQLLLLGQETGGYKLKSVSYSEVVLTAGGHDTTLYMSLSGSSSSGSSYSSGSSSTPSVLKKAGINKADIIPAKDGQEGTVPSELVDKLLMDPYDEMAKMRMIPAKDGGIQIARIEDDSVLGLVGVQQGDIVKSLNNIEISNLGDAANAVNSIISGTRLDVTVIRNGKPVQLNYQVR